MAKEEGIPSKFEKAMAVAAFTLRAVVVTAAISSCPNSAFAIPLQWTLNATFDDGTAVGVFTFDADATTITNRYPTFKITVSAARDPGHERLSEFVYEPPGAKALEPFSDALHLALDQIVAAGNLELTLTLNFAQRLTDAGGSIGVEGGETVLDLGSTSGRPQTRIITEGSAVSVVPEPTTLLLFGTTMAGLGLGARWRRHRQNQN